MKTIQQDFKGQTINIDPSFDKSQNIQAAYVKGAELAMAYLQQVPQQQRVNPTRYWPLCVFSDEGMSTVPRVGNGVTLEDVWNYCQQYKPNATYRINFVDQAL